MITLVDIQKWDWDWRIYSQEELKGLNKEQLIFIIDKLQSNCIRYERKSSKYSQGYNILIDYWDSIGDEEKEDVNKRLEQIGL